MTGQVIQDVKLYLSGNVLLDGFFLFFSATMIIAISAMIVLAMTWLLSKKEKKSMLETGMKKMLDKTIAPLVWFYLLLFCFELAAYLAR